MSTPPPALHRAALVLALAAAACSDQPTTPAAPRAPGGPSADAAAVVSGTPPLVPNHVKYRDRGQKPATGRSGAAALTALALVGRDGTTELQVTASRADSWWRPEGSLRQLQVKAFAPDGRLIATLAGGGADADGPTATRAYPGFARGTRLQVQGVVRGLDGERADLVTVTETVKHRPNLAVQLHAPAQATENLWTVVSATVRETRGDVGASAVCTLYVDGEPADYAQGVWVDAGDAVTCAFTPLFATRGTRRLEVRLEGASPRDDDPSDDTDSATLEVVANGRLSGFARVFQQEDAWSWKSGHSWRGGGAGETVDSASGSSMDQAVTIYAFTPSSLARANTRVELVEETGGVPLYAGTFVLFEDGGTPPPCNTRWDGAAGVTLFVCVDMWTGWSTLEFQRFAGTAVYHSAGYSRVWDQWTGAEQVYHYTNETHQSRGIAVPLGSDYSFNVRVLDGADAFHAHGVVPLSRSSETFGYPYSCWEYAYGDFYDQYCSGSETVRNTATGLIFDFQ